MTMLLTRTIRRPVLTVALAAVLAVTVVGCGDDGSTTDTGGPGTGGSIEPGTTVPGDGVATDDQLKGRAFVGTTVTEGGEPYELAADTTLRLAFDDGQVGADAGCNSMGGEYSLEGDVLVVESLSQTEMACVPEERMEQDTWFAQILTSGPTVLVDGDQLVLTAGDTVITLTDEEVADPDRPLVGTAWELDTVLSGDTASSSADAPVSSTGGAITLVLAEDGTWTTDGGCIPTQGLWTEALGTLSITVSAAPGCVAQTPEDVAFGAVFGGEVAYEIDRDRLTLMVGDQGVSLRAQP